MERNKIYDVQFSKVYNLLHQGRKRITVLMPVGSGRIIVISYIIKLLRQKTTVIVPGQTYRNMFVMQNEGLFEDDNVSVLTANDYLENYVEWDYGNHESYFSTLYVLYETTPNQRVELEKIIPKDSIVVSFGSAGHVEKNSILKNAFEPFECCVFYSESILDIRDLIIASDSERNIIIKQILDTKRNQDKLLYALRITPFNASPGASGEELEALNEKIRERDKKIAYQEETIKVLQSLLNSAGISVEDINESINLIRRIKCEYGDEDSEIINEKVARIIAVESQKLFAQYVVSFSKDYYTSVIKSCLTSDVWNKMTQESKNCLLTGKIAFQSMINIQDESLDYSGVCILASKSLDIEMSKRFFHNYVMYLRQTSDQDSWPKTLFRDGNLLSDEEFTLGSIKYVVGIDKYGVVKNRYVNRLFLKYAIDELYVPSLSRIEIKHHLQKCIEVVETVRENYRNPAAHRVSLDRTTAKECFDYLVDTYKKLKEILRDMK